MVKTLRSRKTYFVTDSRKVLVQNSVTFHEDTNIAQSKLKIWILESVPLLFLLKYVATALARNVDVTQSTSR